MRQLLMVAGDPVASGSFRPVEAGGTPTAGLLGPGVVVGIRRHRALEEGSRSRHGTRAPPVDPKFNWCRLAASAPADHAGAAWHCKKTR